MILVLLGLLLGMAGLLGILVVAIVQEDHHTNRKGSREANQPVVVPAPLRVQGRVTGRGRVPRGRAPIMPSIVWWLSRAVLLAMGITTAPVLGQALVGPPDGVQSKKSAPSESVEQGKAQQAPWHYEGFVDLGYSLNFHFPENHLFRNRSTTPRINELDINMAGAYVRKDPSEQSRWGTEWLVQGGMDAKDYGFGATGPAHADLRSNLELDSP